MPDSPNSKQLSKFLTVSVKISADKGRETFIEDARKESAKKAQQVWDNAFLETPKRKRGRPKEWQPVYKVCEIILSNNDGIFPFEPFRKSSYRQSPSFNDWMEEINERLKTLNEPLSKNTIERHLRNWLIDSSKTKKGFFFKLPVHFLRYVMENSKELHPGFKAVLKVSLEIGEIFYAPVMDKLLSRYSGDQIVEMEKAGKVFSPSLKKKTEVYREKRLKELARSSSRIRDSLALMQITFEP